MSDVVRVDPHVKILDESVVQRAERAGLDALVYAPHFQRLPDIEAEADAHTTDDVLVAPAREVFTGDYRNRKHVLALDLEEPVPDFVTLDAAMAEFERQDATVLAPHPEFLTVGLEAADLREYRDVIDAIEVRNPKHWPHHDRRARQLAVELDLPVYGSSYAHLPWTIGDVWTEFEATGSGSDLRSRHDVAANGSGDVALADGSAATPGSTSSVDVQDANSTTSRPSDDEERDTAPIAADASSLAAALATRERRVRRRPGLGRVARGVAEFSHLFYENSWKKFDRLWLSGTEPTHPHHPAYEGRFDDAFVY